MKLLMWHCKELSYHDGKPSTLPHGIHQRPPAPTAGRYKDILLVFATVEIKDDDDTVGRAVVEVRRMIKMVGQRPVLVMPFAHLSNQLALPADARAAITGIGDGLLKADIEVDVASFGFHKEEFHLSYVARAHDGSVAYREV